MEYTIIMTVHTYGSASIPVEKERVRSECERLRKSLESSHRITERKNTFECIEVVNNNTGEIREYWNNHDNKIQF